MQKSIVQREVTKKKVLKLRFLIINKVLQVGSFHHFCMRFQVKLQFTCIFIIPHVSVCIYVHFSSCFRMFSSDITVCVHFYHFSCFRMFSSEIIRYMHFYNFSRFPIYVWKWFTLRIAYTEINKEIAE